MLSSEASRELFNEHVWWWVSAVAPDLIEQRDESKAGLNIVLLGTFKNWQRIRETRQRMQSLGFHVIAPSGDEIVDDAAGFPLLDTDLSRLETVKERLGRQLSTWEKGVVVEMLFLGAIERSDVCYVVAQDRSDIDDGGYLGTMVASEIGWAEGCGKLVVGSAELSPTLDERDGYDYHWPYYAASVRTMTPEELFAHQTTPKW